MLTKARWRPSNAFTESGRAIKYFKQLTNRIKGKQGLLGEEVLTDIEKEFLEIAELADTDLEKAYVRMKAFITFHDPRTDLSPRDRECVDIAKSFHKKMRYDAIRKAKSKLDSISHALARAQEQEPKEAAETYGSIIELYENMNKVKNPEVRELVDRAKRSLAELQSGARKPPVPRQSPQPKGNSQDE